MHSVTQTWANMEGTNLHDLSLVHPYASRVPNVIIFLLLASIILQIFQLSMLYSHHDLYFFVLHISIMKPSE